MKINMLLILSGMIGILSSSAYAAGTGTDQAGRPCSYALNQYTAGPTVLKDACDFQSDGPGPWCSNLPKVPINHLIGKGVFLTAVGQAIVVVNDPYAELTGPVKSYVASSTTGQNIQVAMKGGVLQVHMDFPTPYGKTLTGAQINSLLLNRPANISYQEVYDKLYYNETCRIPL